MLKKMYKDNTDEVTEILYGEVVRFLSLQRTRLIVLQGQNKCIICVGWDKKITVFLDDPSEDESEPLRVIDAKGTPLHPGFRLAISS
jgi:hypothetical protein